jgi:putative hydrolase of the HAD superfamily
MLDIDRIKGLIFDYGATLDSNGKHWAEVIWDAYSAIEMPVSKPQFRDAYVHGERHLALHPVIQPNHTFLDVLLAKTKIQLKWLIEQGFLPEDTNTSDYSFAISNQCYNFVVAVLQEVKPILKELASRYPMVLVSNFYGNIETVLKDFEIDIYFKDVIESAVVGIRKPNPAIFAMGAKSLQLQPEEVVVIGDSYKKDILPAATIHCQTIWLKGSGWEEDLPEWNADQIIYDFKALRDIF